MNGMQAEFKQPATFLLLQCASGRLLAAHLHDTVEMQCVEPFSHGVSSGLTMSAAAGKVFRDGRSSKAVPRWAAAC